jgi:hypothetical protein
MNSQEISRNEWRSNDNVSPEPYLSRLIAFDAVKWVPR